jgi:GNAT superfamily N-acetyltransferase
VASALTEIGEEPFDSPGPQSIVSSALDELNRRYGTNMRGAHDLHEGDFDPPRGAFLVARQDGHLAGGVGLRPIVEPDLRTGEVKRLWVRPDLRRHGLAVDLMEAIVAAAAARGYAHLYLETGPRQPEARALYERLEWEQVDHYPPGAFTHDTGIRFHLSLALNPTAA